MRSVCDTAVCSNNSQRSSEASWENNVNGKYRRKHRRKKCTCKWNSVQKIPRPLAAAVVLIPNLRFELDLQSLTHDSSCPLSKSFPKTAVVTATLQYCGALLARAIRASITINRGARGCSISHKLDIARMVKSGSRAFRLVKWNSVIKDGIVKSTSDFDTFLRNNLREIECLFRNGDASPCDIDEEGNTLLHVRNCVVCSRAHFR